MINALLDVPRCLDLAACHVGAPRADMAREQDSSRFWQATEGARGTVVFRQRAVEQCLDTAAVLRAYREPLDGETWLTPAGSEQRLLAQVNAILALGTTAVGQAASLAIDGDLPDPGRVFAALLVLGCVDGREWINPMRELSLIHI